MGDSVTQRQHEIESLLVGQAADDTEQWPIVHRVEAHFQLQRTLVGALGGEPVGSIGSGQRGIAGRVPDCAVDAVQDAAQRVGAMAQQGSKPVAKILVLDFAGVGRADRRDQRRQLQAGLEEGKLAVVFDTIEAPGVIGQAERRQVAGGEVALEGDVVHGDDAGGAALVMQPGRGERRLPVVDMDDIGAPGEWRGRLAEQRGNP